MENQEIFVARDKKCPTIFVKVLFFLVNEILIKYT